MDLVKLGSETAKGGFQNERDIANKFNNWMKDFDAKKWLQYFGEDLTKIQSVHSETLGNGYKPDIYVEVINSTETHKHYISIKKANENSNFNQVDKRWIKNYAQLWNMDSDLVRLLKMFTGEISPNESLSKGWITQNQFSALKDNRRMFLNEFTTDERSKIISFFNKNKEQIVSDFIKGRPPYESDWVMVTRYNTHNNTISWKIVSINAAIRIFSEGPVEMTAQGNLAIGQISMQRKGGDGGRDTANMLQFKIKPLLLFEA